MKGIPLMHLKSRRCPVAILLLSALALPAHAAIFTDTPTSPRADAVAASNTLDLAQAYARMLYNDPQIKSATAARDAGRDESGIARAALLPQASITYLRNRTDLKENMTQSTGIAGLPDEHYQVKEKFYGKRAGITVEQSLFDYSAISTYRIGKTQAQYADVQYRLQVQQEAVTLIDTYLNALLARDTLQLAQYQLQVYEDMLRDNQRLIDRGEGTRIDTLETRAQISATRSELIKDENDLKDRLGELSALVGEPVHPQQLMAINLQHGLLPLQRLDLPTLLKDANEQNPQMQAARLSVQYSDLTIEKAKGEFMPKVSAFASREHIESDNIDNMGRDYYDNTIGIQVSIPLFNGGSSYYTARQAYSRREQAQYELEHTSNSTATLLEQYFRVTDTSLSRIRTLRQNVTESEDLVQAMRRSVAGGERTNTDALQAERQAFQARLALIRSYVEWLQAYGKLQFYAGRFSEDDIVVLNRQLVMARQ